MSAIVHDLGENQIRLIKAVLEVPGATRGDACKAVYLDPKDTTALARALSRKGYDIVLTIKKRK